MTLPQLDFQGKSFSLKGHKRCFKGKAFPKNVKQTTVPVLYIFIFCVGQERMRGKELTHILNLFLDIVPRSFTNVTTRVVWMFSWRMETSVKPIGLSARAAGLIFLGPSGMFETEGRSKNNSRGITRGINLMMTIYSLASSFLTVRRHRNQIHALQAHGEIAKAARLRKSAVRTVCIYLHL